MHLAGPEPRLDFGGGSFQCINTTPSGIEIRTVGLWLIRGDTAASIEVSTPVTVGQIVHPSSKVYISDPVLVSGEIAYPVWSRPSAMVQLAVVWSVILLGLTLLTPSIMSISPRAERDKRNEPGKSKCRWEVI